MTFSLSVIMSVILLVVTVDVAVSQPKMIEDTSLLWSTELTAGTYGTVKAAMAEEADLLFVATVNSINVLRASDGSIIDSISTRTPSRTNATQVACSRDGKVLCLLYRYYPVDGDSGGAMIMEYPSKRIIHENVCPPVSIPGGGGILWQSSHVSVSPTGRYVVVPWDAQARIKLIDLQRDTSWLVQGHSWLPTAFDEAETVCVTWDGPNNINDENRGQCRVSWLDNPLSQYKTFASNYGRSSEDTYLGLSRDGRYLFHGGYATESMFDRPVNPGFTVWEVATGRVMNQVHYSGCYGYWGFSPTSDWFSTWVIHPEYGGANYVFFVGDSLPRYRFQTSASFYDRDFSRGFKKLRYDSIITARKIETAIVPVSVDHDQPILRYPQVRRGPSSDDITIDVYSQENLGMGEDDRLVCQMFDLNLRLISTHELTPIVLDKSSFRFVLHMNTVTAPGVYMVTFRSSLSSVRGTIKFLLD